MPTDNLYTGLMAEIRDYLAEVLDDALQEAYRMGWIDAHEGGTV